MSTLDCSDKFDPDANFLVADGPLKGGFVTILSVVDNGKRICGLVSDKDWVTPPIWLEASALKKRGRNWSPVSWIPHIVAIATVVLFLVFEATKSPIALGAAAILFAIGAIAFARALILSRRIKSCPICGTRLDPDTWSHCNRCQWQRPMPHFLPAEMRCAAIGGWGQVRPTASRGQGAKSSRREPALPALPFIEIQAKLAFAALGRTFHVPRLRANMVPWAHLCGWLQGPSYRFCLVRGNVYSERIVDYINRNQSRLDSFYVDRQLHARFHLLSSEPNVVT